MYIPSFGASKLPEKLPLLSTPIFINGRVATPEASINSILSKGEPPAKLPVTSTFLEHDIATKAIISIKKYLLIFIVFSFIELKLMKPTKSVFKSGQK